MTSSLAQHAIAQLMSLAESGELDPWNVQVIDVIDRFLSTLQSLQSQQEKEMREAELSQSGQAFLYASMLILLKADSLARSGTQAEDVEPELFEDEFLSDSDSAIAPLPPFLERTIRRRATTRPLQQRPVSLQELIDQLRRMATTLDDDQNPRRRIRRPRPQSRSQAARTITQLAHQENLSELVAALEQSLHHYQSVYPDQDWISFESLLAWQLEPDRVGAFLGLLFLSAQSKVEIMQSAFYEDIQVRLVAMEGEGSTPSDVEEIGSVIEQVTPDAA
jgi:segregation and condensation protein A